MRLLEKNSGVTAYSLTTMRAMDYCDLGVPPLDAYEKAGKEFLGTQSVRDKPCPMGAFIGPCEFGLVRNIKAGDYKWRRRNELETKRAKDSANYAISAIRRLIAEPLLGELLLVDTPLVKRELYRWLGIPPSNSQMDIVVGFWIDGRINR